MYRYTKFHDDRTICLRVILGKSEGGLHHPASSPPPLCRRGQIILIKIRTYLIRFQTYRIGILYYYLLQT